MQSLGALAARENSSASVWSPLTTILVQWGPLWLTAQSNSELRDLALDHYFRVYRHPSPALTSHMSLNVSRYQNFGVYTQT